MDVMMRAFMAAVGNRGGQEDQREFRRVEGCRLLSDAVSDIKKPMRAFIVSPF